VHGANYQKELLDCWGCYGVYGYYALCEKTPPLATSGAPANCGLNRPCTSSMDFNGHQRNTGQGAGVHSEDRFVVLPTAISYSQAEAKCQTSGYQGLASVHSGAEMQAVSRLCGQVAGGGNGQAIAGVANGCWIGLRANGQRTGFTWFDQSNVDFTYWSNGEPNNWGQDSGGATASSEGETAVEVNMGRNGFIKLNAMDTTDTPIPGLWNDAHVNGIAAHGNDAYAGGQHTDSFGSGAQTAPTTVQSGFGTSGAFGMFPVCQTRASSSSGSEAFGTQSGDPKTWMYKNPVGNYVAIHQHNTWSGAKAFCERNYPSGGFASIHNAQTNQQAWQACNGLLGNIWDSAVSNRRNAAAAKGTSETAGKGGIRACGCWIGLSDKNEADHKEFTDLSSTADIPVPAISNEQGGVFGQPAYTGQLAPYHQCHGFPKPKGFWYTGEPNGLGSGMTAENSVEIRMCFDPHTPGTVPYTLTNCPAMPMSAPTPWRRSCLSVCHRKSVLYMVLIYGSGGAERPFRTSRNDPYNSGGKICHDPVGYWRGYQAILDASTCILVVH
jgi:hypothetical protein